MSEKLAALVISNPKATTISAQLKRLVISALSSKWVIESVETEGQGHGKLLAQEAIDKGYDAVVALGGDGTANEVANALAGSPVALAALPGGSTSVFSRALGFSDDIIEATEQLLSNPGHIMEIDLGQISERKFLFAAGIGLDAQVIARVEKNPRLKTSLRSFYYLYHTLKELSLDYIGSPMRLEIEAQGQVFQGSSLLIQNSDPFTYFGSRPLRLAPEADFCSRGLSLVLVKRFTASHLPSLASALLSGDAQRVANHPDVEVFQSKEAISVRALDLKLYLQADDEFLGRYSKLEVKLSPDKLRVFNNARLK